MEDRLVEFARGLRAAGVRVSVAEAEDALRAAELAGIGERSTLRAALQASLIKSCDDFATFEALFPLYFSDGDPGLDNALADLDEVTAEQVRSFLEELRGRARRLLEWLTSGQAPSADELERIARKAEATRARRPGDVEWITRKMLREMGFDDLDALLDELMDRLMEAGVSDQAIEDLLGVVMANRDSLREAIARRVGLSIRRDSDAPARDAAGELADLPLSELSQKELAGLRGEVGRMAARLRSRASLRYRRSGRGRLDPKRTLRANQRFGGVPVELRHRRPKRKPSWAVICDVSTSMRPLSEFLLHLVYELQDQVAKSRSFVFNADLVEVSAQMAARRPAEAVAAVLDDNPPGYYATDFGRSLETLVSSAPEAIDRRTTLIVLGDARNNYRPPRADLLKRLRARSRRLIWLNPESQREWGSGDSDMPEYVQHCDDVYQVASLAQLSAAVDRMLTI